MRPAVFLDRDGVLNQLVNRNGTLVSPRRMSDFKLVDSAIDAISRLKSAGYKCIVVTNQPDIARGLMDETELIAMSDHLQSETGVDGIYVCPHDNNQCKCRKPLPGLLKMAAQDHDIDISNSWMVGDRISDIQAGASMGCKTVLVLGEQSDFPGNSHTKIVPTHFATSLTAAVTCILNR